MDAALSSLKRECVEQGPDYEEVQHQRETEIRLMKKLGLTLPGLSRSVAVAEAGKVDESPRSN
jgi:capsid protein